LVLLLWHNQLFTSPLIYKKYRSHRELAAMVSASSDGEILSGILNSVGMKTIRGSTGRDGVKALTKAFRHLRSGTGDVAITPDGSRGPCYHFNPGPLLFVDKLKTSLLLASLTTPKPIRLRSWDQFQIPLHFSTIHIKTITLTPGELPSDQQEKADFLRLKLLELSNLPTGES